MKTILVLILAALAAGCSTTSRRAPGPSTVPVARAVQVAGESARRATVAVERAQTTSRGAAAPLQRLSQTASPSQRPDVVAVSNAIRSLDTDLAEARSNLIASSAAHAEAVVNTTELQGRIDGMADDLGRAQDAERKSRQREGFWRAWAFRLGAAASLLLLWALRRPLLRLCGVPAF